jgi:hypothetical protein
MPYFNQIKISVGKREITNTRLKATSSLNKNVLLLCCTAGEDRNLHTGWL